MAAEENFERQFKQYRQFEYLTADLYQANAMLKMDITDIQFPDNSFDVIICNHVFEHVEDDVQAMREFNRVIRPEGWIIISVPITAERTFADPNAKTPEDRLRIYGQEDHVRQYGLDVEERLAQAGGKVQAVYPADFLTPQMAERCRTGGEPLFFCKKC